MKSTDNFDGKDNGEMMTGFYNACINGEVALKDQIEAEMNSRGWTVDFDGVHNPSWTGHGSLDDRNAWSRLFG